MFQTKTAAGALGVVAGFALVAFAGPAATADETTPPQDPCVTIDVDAEVTTVAAVQTAVSVGKPDKPGKPENPGSNGKGADKGDKDRDRTQDQDCEQVQDQTKDQTRAELRAEIRANGGSWGAYQRQGALIKVASKLAERYGATPENTNAHSLGRILTLINAGLPEALQIDVEVFLAQYELALSDITWPEGMEPEPTPEPSPSPSASPSVLPSASPNPTPSVSPTA